MKPASKPSVSVMSITGIALLVWGLSMSALVWPYVINTWLAYADAGTPVVWWHGVLIGLVPRSYSLMFPIAVLTVIAVWIF